MASVFSMIIAGHLPGRFVWRDERAVAFLTINPISPGHTLVVPRAEVDHWIDLDPEAWAHLQAVSHTVGQGIARAFAPRRVGQLVVGREVPHVHVHVLGFEAESDLRFENADPNPDPGDLDDAANRLRAALRALGHGENVPD